MKIPKILIYTSSSTKIPHREGGGHETGTWLSEITDTLVPLFKAGAQLDFATPDGKTGIIDKAFKKSIYYNFSKKKFKKKIWIL